MLVPHGPGRDRVRVGGADQQRRPPARDPAVGQLSAAIRQPNGAQLDLAMREGSRDRAQVRGAVSGTGVTFLAEGPLAAGRGSWLASFRKRLHRLARAVRRARHRRHVRLRDARARSPSTPARTSGSSSRSSAAAPRARPRRRPGPVGERLRGRDNSTPRWPRASWRLAPAAVVAHRARRVHHRHLREHERLGRPIADGADLRASIRTDTTFVVAPSITLDAGVEASWLDMSARGCRTGPARPVRRCCSTASPLAGRRRAGRLCPGTLRAAASGSLERPRRFAHRRRRRGHVAVGTGRVADLLRPDTPGRRRIFQQSLTLEQAALLFRAPEANDSVPCTVNASIEGALGRHTRLIAAAFVRDEDDMLRAYGTEYYLNGSAVVQPSDIPVYANALSGRARDSRSRCPARRARASPAGSHMRTAPWHTAIGCWASTTTPTTTSGTPSTRMSGWACRPA